MIWKLLTPSALGLLLLLLVVAVDCGMGQGGWTSRANGDSESFRTIGYPPLLTIRELTRAKVTTTSYELHWLGILGVLIPAYLLTMALGRWITGLTPQQAGESVGRRNPALTLLLVIVVTLLLAGVAAAMISKSMWGYYLWRPPLDARVSNASRLITLTPFISNKDETQLVIAGRSAPTTAEIADAREREGGYYAHLTRAAGVFADRGMLPRPLQEMSPEKLAPLQKVIADTGRLVPGTPGYEARAKPLRGFVFEIESPDREPLMLITANSGEISNDHYAYYEFLFTNEEPPRLLHEQHFFYDVAGMEGMEFRVIMLAVAVLGLLVTVPVTIVVMSVRRMLRRRREGPGFEVELVPR